MSLGATWIALSLVASPGATVVDVNEREPAVMLVMTPNGAAARTRTAEIFRVAAAELEPATSLVLVSAEQVGTDVARFGACPEDARLSCWVRAVRRDYDRLALEHPNGLIDSYQSHVDRVRERGRPYPRFLMVVALYPGPGGGDRVTAMLINTDQALAHFHGVRRDAGWKEEVENRIFADAIQARPATVRQRDPAQMQAFFRAAIQEVFAGVLERGGFWQPYGAVSVSGPPGLVVELDGSVVASTADTPLLLTSVMPGGRTVVVSNPDGSQVPFRRVLTVERGRTAEVSVTMVERPDASAAGLRTATFWSGIGVAAAGAVLTAYGALAPRDITHVRSCRGGGCDGGNAGFATLCELSSSTPQGCGSTGVLVAPLGYSLIATGGVWLVGTQLFGDDGDVPWVQLVAGLAVGAVSYGLSAALDGGG